MSILKNILRPFVEFKEEESSGSSKELKTQTVNNKSGQSEQDYSPVTSTSQASASVAPSTSTGINTSLKFGEYQKHFDNLIEEANAKNPVFQGTDFKEFIDSKIDVEAITDEETKYKTAFNVLKRTGLTKEKLISTGKQYINVIDQDLKGFNNAYVQQYNTEVEQKEVLLQKKSQELQAINDKIALLNKDITQMSQEITQSKEKLNVNKNSFVEAGEIKKKEIEAELQKIAHYFS